MSSQSSVNFSRYLLQKLAGILNLYRAGGLTRRTPDGGAAAGAGAALGRPAAPGLPLLPLYVC